MRKKIKVKFVDFGDNTFREELIMRILNEKYEVIISEKPDYLFFSVFSDLNLKYKDCIRIFITTENLAPDYNLCDYSIDYEWMDYGDRHLRFPIYGFEGYSKSYELCLSKHLNVDKKILLNKSEFCSFVYSNKDADQFRTVLYNSINDYRHVNSGGKYMNNINKPEGVIDKLAFQKKHKFCIACENSSHPGYTTEKIVEAFAAKSIPIYWGDPQIKKIFNEKAFICVSDFAEIEDCVEFIKDIDLDDQRYLSMLNEPAVINEQYNLNIMIDNMKNFLFNIMDTDKELAFRRNRVFWGDIYFSKHQRWKKVFDIVTFNVEIKFIKNLRLNILKLLKLLKTRMNKGI